MTAEEETKQETKEEEAAPDENGEAPEEMYDLAMMESNSLGYFDGANFYMDTMPVWYMKKLENLDVKESDWPASGQEGSVHFEQTMSRVTMWYHLTGGEVNWGEDDITVQMSSYEIRVVLGKVDAKAKKSGGGKSVDAVSGEFFADIRPGMSTWFFEDWGSERYLTLNLVKFDNKGWRQLFAKTPLSVHRKGIFPWSHTAVNENDVKLTKTAEEKLENIPMGERQDAANAYVLGIEPERLVTGVSFQETDTKVACEVHLDEQMMAVAKGRAPLAEFFSVVVTGRSIEVVMKGDGLPVVWAELTEAVVAEATLWAWKVGRQWNPSKEADLKTPALYNMTLTIVMTKARPGMWGECYSDIQHPEFAIPKDLLDPDGVKSRLSVLSPGSAKPSCCVQRARDLVTDIKVQEDVILNKVYLTIHLWDKLPEYFQRFRVNPETFFAVEVREQLVSALAIGDGPYPMCELKLFGTCDPARATWELTAGKLNDEDTEHMCLKITLTKSAAARGTKWGENAFTKLEPYQVSQELIQGPMDPDYAALRKEQSDELNTSFEAEVVNE